MKKFKADLATAQQKVKDGNIEGLDAIKIGISDGEVVLVFKHQNPPSTMRIHALAQDTSEYPEANAFMLYTEMDDPPGSVTGAIRDASDYVIGVSVYEMASQVAAALNARLNPKTEQAVDSDSEPQFDGELEDNPDADDDDDFDLDEYDYEVDAAFGLPSTRPKPSQPYHPTAASTRLLHRIRQDLKQVHNAGYKLGIIEQFAKTVTSGVFSISIRVGALGLSEEAMEAWDLDEDEYIVLLIRTDDYVTFEDMVIRPASETRPKFRVGKCRSHKPSLHQALCAFDAGPKDAMPRDANTGVDDQNNEFQKLFLSNSLDQFMDESFVSLSKYREHNGCTWEQANEAVQKMSVGTMENSELGYDPMDVEDTTQQHHHILLQDHLRENQKERSFPLVAMQFAMQYLIRCTEYCLRCHRKLEKGFEALRPYVCSNPLCLFQYMSMGFGPSIEHEIQTEPYVVDLLISLCYAALRPSYLAGGPQMHCELPIRDLPVGLQLKVADFSGMDPKFRARLQGNRLVWDEDVSGLGSIMAPSKWIAFRQIGTQCFRHARVIDFNLGTKSAALNIVATSGRQFISSAATPSIPGTPTSQAMMNNAEPTLADGQIVDVFPYMLDFDLMTKQQQGLAMVHILDTLPRVLDIAAWLGQNSLKSLKGMESISPAAASLLQWIVSSNRSCIFQVDRRRFAVNPPTGSAALTATDELAGRGRNREHERIRGMPGWIQFRFAQGSPDKELRFNRALQEVAQSRHMEQPTIFAWHGSRLSNWHSIVRTGLDYNSIANGRAYGNGVYFSPHFSTSFGYSSGGHFGGIWPNSNLNFSACMSLNEIINAPDRFTSYTPHYVVSQPDWHQCRYLFIQPINPITGITNEEKPANIKFLPLAKGLEPTGQSNQHISIPASAMPTRNIGVGRESSVPTKRSRSQCSDSRVDNEDAEDVAIVFEALGLDDNADPPAKRPATGDKHRMTDQDDNLTVTMSADKSLTDFVPGALDLSSLPRLKPPSFANDSALRAIGREVKKVQAVQSKTPLHELGWYIDFDQISNLFQWIVELHSFDASLPLAIDMKNYKVTSVVLEIRFPKDYPFNPPFVRVVRPKFLPFMDGGGGHVTIGGALCMELLTTSGWSPANSIESVLLQVRMALCSTDPAPARLMKMSNSMGDYAIGEAVEAYIRAAGKHGWKVPEDLRNTVGGISLPSFHLSPHAGVCPATGAHHTPSISAPLQPTLHLHFSHFPSFSSTNHASEGCKYL
ncbi:ubiquitin-conjugating enzyme E2 Q2 [Podospora fimiseda]|uniref:Ubiquitin-conjugating enzyme E2 Q2 n=1 Tax=Podospora fimiseda TaxID=252190 RepID=A0AAN7BRS7_9PEZI|nr:ubiquitin-conjugating enzyme E2 Q2 [Podospora fimiseda]